MVSVLLLFCYTSFFHHKYSECDAGRWWQRQATTANNIENSQLWRQTLMPANDERNEWPWMTTTTMMDKWTTTTLTPKKMETWVMGDVGRWYDDMMTVMDNKGGWRQWLTMRTTMDDDMEDRQWGRTQQSKRGYRQQGRMNASTMMREDEDEYTTIKMNINKRQLWRQTLMPANNERNGWRRVTTVTMMDKWTTTTLTTKKMENVGDGWCRTMIWWQWWITRKDEDNDWQWGQRSMMICRTYNEGGHNNQKEFTDCWGGWRQVQCWGRMSMRTQQSK